MVEITKCPPGVAEGADYLRTWSFMVKGAGYEPAKKTKPRKSKRSRRKARAEKKALSDKFYKSYEWRKLRYEVLKKYGGKCQCCGRSAKDGAVMHVDHIKPRKKYPELAMDINNLQVLCNLCNHGKGNWDTTDWRDIC